MVLGRSSLGAILLGLGAVLIIVGALWMTLLFPGMVKMPTDYDETISFTGTYTVMNPATRSLVSIPVVVKREQKAVGQVNNTLLIDEEMSVVNVATGDRMSPFEVKSKLAVDRSTRQHVPDNGDLRREGGFGFPSDLKEGENYQLWNPGAGKALEARYSGKEEFRGLIAFLYQTVEKDLPLPPDSQTGMEQKLDMELFLKAEPKSGATVAQKSLVTRSMVVPGMGKTPIFISDIGFSESSVADLVDTAKDARSKLLWLGSYIPWVIIGVGIALALSGVGLTLRGPAKKPKPQASVSPE